MSNRADFRYPVLLVMLLLAFYVPLIIQQNDFRTDDYYLLTVIAQDGLPNPFSGVQYSYFSAFRVLPMATFWLDHTLYGGHAMGYYLFNLIVHVAAALMLFFLVRLVLERFFQSGSTFFALLLALAFGVHADLFYNVVWISNRTEGLLILLTLVACYAWLQYFLSRKTGWYIAGFAGMLLALLTKEQAIHLPLLFLLIGVVAVRSGHRGMSTRRILLFGAPLFLVAGSFFLLRLLYDPGATHFLAFLTPKKLFSFMGIQLIAFHPTVARPVFTFLVGHKVVAVVVGVVAAGGLTWLALRFPSRVRMFLLAASGLLLATAFPRTLYHVLPRINSVQVVVLLLLLAAALQFVPARWRIVLVSTYLFLQLAGTMYELHYWRIETGNEKYTALLSEEGERSETEYRLITWYHDHARYAMHFLGTGAFGTDDRVRRGPLYVDRRYGARRGEEFSITRDSDGVTLRMQEPRAVFLYDSSVSLPRGMRLELADPAADYGYSTARIWLAGNGDMSVLLVERNHRLERLN